MNIRSIFSNYKVFSLTLLFAVIFLGSFRTDPGVLEAVVKKLQEFHSRNPQEKLYVQLDKPFYAAGDSIWFKAYLVEASLHSLDSQSQVMYVELLNSANAIVARRILYVNGVSYGDFALPDTLHEGKYLVRAYTNYMRNAGEDFFFKKEISILNPAPAYANEQTAEMINPDSIDLQFFPEGGELVACGKFNRVAFKATGQDGKGVALEGEILDDQQTRVATFKTEHNGMGLVWLNPAPGKSYHARITKPAPVNRSYSLPHVTEKGYALQVNQAGKNINVIVFSSSASVPPFIGIVVQSRGKTYHVQEGTIKPEGFLATIPINKLPEGINQITLFDAAGQPVAERLVYIPNTEILSLKLETVSTVFNKREHIAVHVDASYPNGTPALGNFSITVYDDALLQKKEEYPLTITNYLSLTSDLKGNIENPGYYFKDDQPETRKNLDLLMLVNGWRRFTWKDVLEQKASVKGYVREKGIPISGRVMKVVGKKALTGGTVKIMTMTGNIIITKPDSLGYFYNDDLQFYDSMTLVIQTENEKGKKQPNRFLVNPVKAAPASYHAMTDFIPFKAPEYIKQQTEKNSLDKSIKATILQELVVVEKKPDPEIEKKTLVSLKLARHVGDVGKNYNLISDLVQSKVPGAWVNIPSNPMYQKSIRMHNKGVKVAVNGREVDMDFLESIPPSNIEYIESIDNGGAIFEMAPVMNFITKTNFTYEVVGMTRIKYNGFYMAREFYSPRYDVPQDRHQVADKRTTLFWEPMIDTDEQGRAGVSFFAADVSSTYRVIVEGITPDGCPGTATMTFTVK